MISTINILIYYKASLHITVGQNVLIFCINDQYLRF